MQDYSHYGRQELNDAIEKVADAWGKAYEAKEFHEGENKEIPPKYKELQVNDMSKPWGGYFGFYKEKDKDGHKRHKWGQNVDISYNRMNQKQKDWFDKNALDDTGGKFSLVKKHAKNTEKEHWHCSKNIKIPGD